MVVDGLVGVIPSETVLHGAGVGASRGETSVVLLIAIAAASAVVGDLLAFTVGAKGGTRLRDRLVRSEKGERRVRAVRGQLDKRPWLLTIARFVPGLRTVTVYSAGSLSFPRRRFLAYEAPGGAGLVGLQRADRVLPRPGLQERAVLGGVRGVGGHSRAALARLRARSPREARARGGVVHRAAGRQSPPARRARRPPARSRIGEPVAWRSVAAHGPRSSRTSPSGSAPEEPGCNTERAGGARSSRACVPPAPGAGR